ncbi:Glutamate 5-kinase [Stanieria cyanosphaera PCC 7437]|uniref:Glutamate 5-kinase n=1 Tax=Stanieria cyanosphaera (strain ATCC 29371 / PCC 7437) TaxID=111780 RepID=K9XVL6_STAC7|nr:glutamate 5-kinase [Stanieria cyanosphaera]AFZ36635.1 Glutamate 5-kinase [Stanieria cyanosphaera PCC 7437]
MSESQTIVIKIGTSSLTKATGQIAVATIASLVETLTSLRSDGHRVVLVSSGAVGVGCARLNLKERPRKIAVKQAVAAVGQGRLMRIYDDLFSSLQQPIAQVLLTRRELMERTSYVNAFNTFIALLELGVIPIVNENDTVAIDELKFGDNDTLSALVASLIEADWLFILTDVDRLYSADPRLNPDAQPIELVGSAEFKQLQVEAGGNGSQWGTGGMATKLAAARIATSSGVRTVITQGKQPQNILQIIQGEPLGTQFEPQSRADNARKRWINYGLIPMGKLYLDRGAVKAICQQGKSLLPAGIIKIEGDFVASDAVQLCDGEGREIGRGLVNYSSTEITQIKGHHSEKIAQILGYEGADTVVHRNNLIIKD